AASRRQRNVDVVAPSGTRTLLTAMAGVGREAAVLVYGNRQGTPVFPERLLRAVAVMDVVVDEGDALQTQDLERVFSGNCPVAKDAEADAGFAGGVMPGRTHQCISILDSASNHGVY